MKKNIALLVLAITFNAQAQNTAEIQKNIDETVWKPFQKAFQTLDGDALNALYANEVLRVTPGGIDTENSFKKANVQRFATNRTNGDSIALDWWWDNRKTNDHTSYEVGFYRIRFTSKSGETRYSYGQFHIVLQKINDHWKITQDWDTAVIGGQKIDKTFFEKNTPLQF